MNTYLFKSDGGVPAAGVRFLNHPEEDEVTRWLALPHGRIVRLTIEVDVPDPAWIYTVSLVRRGGAVSSWELPKGKTSVSFSDGLAMEAYRDLNGEVHKRDHVTDPDGDLVQMKIQRGDFGAIDSTGTPDMGALSPTSSPFDSIAVALDLELIVPVGWDDDPLSMNRVAP